MSDTQKKQSFLHGTALLAIATAIVKIIGAVYSIPLKAIIGDKGFGYYSTAYELYTVLLTISLTGLPVAMSRMISQASSLGHYNQVRNIYKTSRTIFLVLGSAGALAMMLLCKFLAANVMNHPDAWVSILCLGPSALLICLMSAYRGFFQGQGNMLPTSISQVLEAFVKLVMGIGLAFAALQLTKDASMAAGGAIFGVSISCFVSAIYLFGCLQKSYRMLPVTQEPATSFATTAKQLLAIAVPITIGSAGLSILNACEIGIYMRQLLEHMTQDMADTQKGIYNFIQKIFNMPVAFVTPITVSIIPAISGQLTLKNARGARATAESSVRVMSLISMPCSVGLMVLAGPVTSLLGGYTGENLKLATTIMTILGACIIFYTFVLLTNALMQSHGHVNLPVINMFIGGLLKLATVFILTANPHIGILGAPIGSLACYVTISVLNFITMRRSIPNCPALVGNLCRSALAALIMGVFVYGAWYGLANGLHITSRALLCGLPIIVGVAVYVVCAVKLRAITREDCLLLPKGEKIAKLLHL